MGSILEATWEATSFVYVRETKQVFAAFNMHKVAASLSVLN